MDAELEYSRAVGLAHRKRYGQFFTPERAARFMVEWACRGADTVLDPAVGNSIFLRSAREQYPGCTLVGYEVDGAVLDHFGNPARADLRREDYLRGDWESRYDAIVCNPPYNRFQAVEGREELLEDLCRHTGVRCSGLTNLYALFLMKSIFQLSPRGRLAYLVPSEFLNSRYGEPVKRLMVEEGLLRAILNLDCAGEVFPGAVTTACILLLDREEKTDAAFYRISALEELERFEALIPTCRVSRKELRPENKWRPYLLGEDRGRGEHLRPLSDFCRVTRGIATGANGFYCFSQSKMEACGLDERYFTPCICRSADVHGPVFTREDFRALAEQDRTVYLLDVTRAEERDLARYVARGEEQGVDRRYLPAHRTPWYSVERKDAAPIWVSSACRNGMKFVRNRAGIASLSTFHGIFMKEPFRQDADLLFACLLTPTVQGLLEGERKELGGGLHKFQPNDLNRAMVPDLERLSPESLAALRTLARALVEHFSADLVDRVDNILQEEWNT